MGEETPSTPRPRARAAFIVSATIGSFLVLFLMMPACGRVGCGRGRPCMNNVRQIGLACKQYAIDHDDRLPNRFSDLKEYMPLGKIFFCQSQPIPKEELTWENVDRLASFALVQNLTEAADSDQPLIIEKAGGHKGGGNVFFIGGQAKFEDETELRALRHYKPPVAASTAEKESVR